MLDRRILIVGGYGFIGRAVTKYFEKQGYEVWRTSHNLEGTNNTARCIHMNILDVDQSAGALKQYKFKYCIYLSWYTGKQCHTTVANLDWLLSSISFIKNFYQYGGEWLFCAGSVSEYDYSYGVLNEQTPLNNSLMYGICKTSVILSMQEYARQVGVGFCAGRIFNCYGPYEKPSRLMPSVICSILNNQAVRVSSCDRYQDYIYVGDIAIAIYKLFRKQSIGIFNLCTGNPLYLKDIVNKIARKLNYRGEILWGSLPDSFEYKIIVGDVAKLKNEINWTPNVGIDQGLELTIDWWKAEMVNGGKNAKY